MKINDKYDKAIKFFIKHPNEIISFWSQPHSIMGCLFTYVTPTGKREMNNFKKNYGCLTEIRTSFFSAWTEKLTDEILNDERIPSSSKDIKLEHLPIFAEWQRKIDKELNRI